MAMPTDLDTLSDARTSRMAAVPSWVKWAVLAGLAVPHLITGLWALLTPSGWFDAFPGLGPALVAAEPPFNAHLATDAGAGFFATGVALVLGFVRPTRQLLTMALITYLAFALPHALYHTVNPAPGLSSAEDVINALALWTGVTLAVVCLWGTRTPFVRRT